MKNWKTVAVSIFGGILIGLNQGLRLGLDESHINYLTIFLLSLFSKDYDTTGAGWDATKKHRLTTKIFNE